MSKKREIETTLKEADEMMERLKEIKKEIQGFTEKTNKLSSEADKLRIDIIAKYDRLEKLGVE